MQSRPDKFTQSLQIQHESRQGISRGSPTGQNPVQQPIMQRTTSISGNGQISQNQPSDSRPFNQQAFYRQDRHQQSHHRSDYNNGGGYSNSSSRQYDLPQQQTRSYQPGAREHNNFKPYPSQYQESRGNYSFNQSRRSPSPDSRYQSHHHTQNQYQSQSTSYKPRSNKPYHTQINRGFEQTLQIDTRDSQSGRNQNYTIDQNKYENDTRQRNNYQKYSGPPHSYQKIQSGTHQQFQMYSDKIRDGNDNIHQQLSRSHSNSKADSPIQQTVSSPQQYRQNYENQKFSAQRSSGFEIQNKQQEQFDSQFQHQIGQQNNHQNGGRGNNLQSGWRTNSQVQTNDFDEVHYQGNPVVSVIRNSSTQQSFAPVSNIEIPPPKVSQTNGNHQMIESIIDMSISNQKMEQVSNPDEQSQQVQQVKHPYALIQYLLNKKTSSSIQGKAEFAALLLKDQQSVLENQDVQEIQFLVVPSLVIQKISESPNQEKLLRDIGQLQIKQSQINSKIQNLQARVF